MKITLESTEKIVNIIISGATVPARIWQGETESGIPIHCYVTRVAVAEGRDIAAIPLRLIL